jgi:hypothetical protein
MPVWGAPLDTVAPGQGAHLIYLHAPRLGKMGGCVVLIVLVQRMNLGGGETGIGHKSTPKFLLGRLGLVVFEFLLLH